jgi:hypothetical protein
LTSSSATGGNEIKIDKREDKQWMHKFIIEQHFQWHTATASEASEARRNRTRRIGIAHLTHLSEHEQKDFSERSSIDSSKHKEHTRALSSTANDDRQTFPRWFRTARRHEKKKSFSNNFAIVERMATEVGDVW